VTGTLGKASDHVNLNALREMQRMRRGSRAPKTEYSTSPTRSFASRPEEGGVAD